MRESVERETVGLGGNNSAGSGRKRDYITKLDKVTTSFFVTNFPDDATTEDLWKLFLKFGKVGEVYIPKKLDKRGRRFGFVKFREVKEVEELSDSLRDVWIGMYKLHVNLSRFGRSESKEASSQIAPIQRAATSMVERQPGRSFRTALLDETQVLKVPVNEDLCKELRGSMVGTLAREKDVRRIQTTIYMEGFQSISVTHMGGNMALVRSSNEGDVERLLRSKKECMEYYFSELKPWNPGLLAVQREVWIQVYGIPLHIWGEDFFKIVGAKLGVFLDFDEETARMARFDVARLKILTATWAFIDLNLKVEVEGVTFNIWVVEERGRQHYVAVVGGEREDVGSLVVPSEASDAVEDFVGVADNSGEDEVSGSEMDREVATNPQHGGRNEAKSDNSLSVQVTKRREDFLTCEKSTNFSNSQKEIISVGKGCVDNEEAVIRQGEKVSVFAVSTKEGEAGICRCGGTKEVADKQKFDLGNGGPTLLDDSPIVNLGLVDSIPDPILLGHDNLAHLDPDPSKQKYVDEEVVLRYSSVSEPEEVLSSHKTKSRKQMSKLKKQKSCSKFNQLGVPLCIQLVESLKSGGAKSRRRRIKGAIQSNAEEVGGVEVSMEAFEAGDVISSDAGGYQRRKEKLTGLMTPRVTPASGINLISGSQSSQVPNYVGVDNGKDKEIAIEAAKLLSIQKEVGFSFEEADGETVKQLMTQERCDRVKKMEWEQKEGDQ
ncbi:RNA recognition motif [Trifolium medium]|uniref:RNA recognition motif n=1 Tax=Trifolium medium TaxID=97028 RepID=A0A392LZW5_9FABA|nr:RNA recognition motif [Trifolium medium]